MISFEKIKSVGLERVKISIPNKVEREVFDKYKEICDQNNAFYDKNFNSQVATIDNVANLIEDFLSEKMKCIISPEVIDWLGSNYKQVNKDLIEAEMRLVEMERKLKKKGKELFKYQRTGVLWLSHRRRALLNDEMGLGKTVETVMALDANSPIVIVCPKVAKMVWYNHILQWRPDLKPFVFIGNGSFTYPKPGFVYIYNYNILPPEDSSLYDNPPKNLVIVGDEIHMCKNPKAKRTKSWRCLRDKVMKVMGRILLLTGTPLLNRPPELWSVLDNAHLAEDAYGNWRNFVRVFNGVAVTKGYDWKNVPIPEAATLLKRVSLQRKRVDVMKDLPEKLPYEDYEVDITDKKIIKRLNKIRKAVEHEGFTMSKISLEQLMSLKVVFEQLSAIRADLARIKIPEMLEHVEQYEEQDEPLVVFSAHRDPILALEKRPGWAIITGSTGDLDRSKIIEDFQAGKYKGIGITIQSGGVGITLTHAAHALFVDLMWTPAMNWQAEDRLCRIGQTRGVLIKRLVTKHPVEKHVHHLLTLKQMLIENSVDAAKTTEEDVTKYNMNLDILKNVETYTKSGESVPAILRLKEILAGHEKLETPEEFKKKENHRRDANGPVEIWAKKAIITLDDLNPDVAREVNGVGFNKIDSLIGRSFAVQLRNKQGLTEKQWRMAVSMCKKYQKQVGTPPIM